jgi:hypothetical protein
MPVRDTESHLPRLDELGTDLLMKSHRHGL